MFDKKFFRSGLQSFQYKETLWYQAIHAENRNYKHTLILFSLGGFLAGIVCLAAIAVFARRFDYLAVYILYAAALSALLILQVFLGKIKYMVNALLTLPFIVLMIMLYAPGERWLYFPVFTMYPAFALHFRGTRKGFFLSAALAGMFATCFLLQSVGILPRWTVHISWIEFITDLCTFAGVSVFSYLTERRQENLVERLADRFVYDDVTGLPGKDVMIHSILPGRPCYLAIVKVENFSNLVALFGYEFSDTISQFASRKLIKYESKFGYKTFQLKYNEYGILVDNPPGSSVADISQFLNALVKALEVESLPWERDRISLVYRVGGTIVAPCDSQNPFSRADIALKKAERSHSVVTVFEDGIEEKDSAYDCVIRFSELVSNRESGSFRAVFQPVFNSDGSEVAWFEALLRVQRQDGSYSSIYPYLGIAKSTGFYQCLTDFIIRESAEMICTHDVNISINIAIHDIVRPDFILLVDEVYEKIRDKKGRIIFEILESDELVELDKCIWFIDYIARYGFKIAIDDFGTGYSNYSTLINLPIDIVKIDGSLIRKIHHDENARILVEGIVQFCERSNKKTVAEYVESREVFDSLRSMRIDFLQGFYLAEPAAMAVSAV